MVNVDISVEKCLNVCWMIIILHLSDLFYCQYMKILLCRFTWYCTKGFCPIETPNIPRSKSHIHFPPPKSFQTIRRILRVL